MVATPVSSLCVLEPLTFGVGTMVQAEPFQCSARVMAPMSPFTSACPTAHMSVDATPSTSSSTLFRSGWLGLGTMVKAEPFQCSVRVLSSVYPTPHTSAAEKAWMPRNALGPAPRVSLETRSKELPVQCSTRVPSAATTAQTSHPDVAGTQCISYVKQMYDVFMK